MASSNLVLHLVVFLTFTISSSLATRRLTESMAFQYHRGPLLSGNIPINLIWYGHFTPTQRAIVSDFITSLSSSPNIESNPSVAMWWNSIGKYHRLANPNKPSSPSLSLGKQVTDEAYSLGKSLMNNHLVNLASKAGATVSAISVVLTASDVAVDGFCMSRCGTHGASSSTTKFTYIWVGNSETQCPGQCAWPFHQPIYGPQSPPLVAPNNDVGLDGMVINLASMLAATVTNPYGNGYFQGPKEAPLEASSACPGIYAKGASWIRRRLLGGPHNRS